MIKYSLFWMKKIVNVVILELYIFLVLDVGMDKILGGCFNGYLILIGNVVLSIIFLI